jgi:hypothetical protein
MNSREFINAIKTIACDSPSHGFIGALIKPPGRSPDRSLVVLSEWFNGLAASDKEMIERIVDLATKNGVYGLLLVLDNLVTVGKPQLRIELSIIDGDDRIVLNDASKEFLTDLFKED